MIQITVITTPTSPATDYYRTVTPLKILERRHPDKYRVNCVEPDNARWHALSTSDIVVFCRPNGHQFLGMLEECKKMAGVRIWCDYDDDLLNITQANPAAVHFNHEQVRDTVTKSLALADIITVSTPELQHLYGKMTDRKEGQIPIIPNAYNDDLVCGRPFRTFRPADKPVKFFWRGSASHLQDIWTVRESFRTMIKSKKFHFEILGLDPWMLYPFADAGDFNLTRWQTLYTYLHALDFKRPDWIVVPLEDTAFNRAKSNIAWIEGTTVGAACLAPRLPEWIRPGIVNYDDDAHLKSLLGEIATGRMKKDQYVDESRTWLYEFLRIDRINETRVRVIEALTKPKLKAIPA